MINPTQNDESGLIAYSVKALFYNKILGTDGLNYYNYVGKFSSEISIWAISERCDNVRGTVNTIIFVGTSELENAVVTVDIKLCVFVFVLSNDSFCKEDPSECLLCHSWRLSKHAFFYNPTHSPLRARSHLRITWAHFLILLNYFFLFV